MSGSHLQRLIVGWVLVAWATQARAADEFSGADNLRAIYSAEFRFTRQGFPVVPVAIAEGLARVTISAGSSGGLRLFPEGESGPEVRGEDSWQVRASATAPAKLHHWAVVWRGKPGQGSEADAQIKRWKDLGENPRRFEQGTVFGVGGEVLDRREVLVGVGPFGKPEEAEHAFEGLARKATLASPGVFTELVDRPRGQLEAVGRKTGMNVRNEGVLWFVAGGDSPLQVEAEGTAGRTPSKVSGAYFGKLYVTLDRNGSLAVVNALPEDRLLAGLLPAEIFPSAPEEALKAQVVAARGELLVKIGTRHIGDPFRLCSQTHCQVYSGAGRETARTTAAVAATRGEVTEKIWPTPCIQPTVAATPRTTRTLGPTCLRWRLCAAIATRPLPESPTSMPRACVRKTWRASLTSRRLHIVVRPTSGRAIASAGRRSARRPN
jgi:hypothetical protein